MLYMIHIDTYVHIDIMKYTRANKNTLYLNIWNPCHIKCMVKIIRLSFVNNNIARERGKNENYFSVKRFG